MKKALGIFILILIFAGLFALVAKDYGIVESMKMWGIALIVGALFFGALLLIGEQ